MDHKEIIRILEKGGTLKELTEAGLTRVIPEGIIMNSERTLAFYPSGSERTPAPLEVEGGLVKFDVSHLETIIKVAKQFHAENVEVCTSRDYPLIVRTEKGIFAIAPRIG